MTPRRKKRPPLVVGWREWVLLDGLECDLPVKAKVDTGAATSALHAPVLKRFERDGEQWVSFMLRPHQRKVLDSRRVEAKVIGERRVMSSNGKSELRPVIETSITIGDRRWTIELTLTRRDRMRFRMLLGRKALRGKTIVDVSRSHAAGLPYLIAPEPPPAESPTDPSDTQ